MSTDVRDRPRVADHVAIRQHVTEDGAFAIVEDGARGVFVKVGPTELEVILAADGSRDPEGIALAVRRRGVVTSSERVQAFFAELRAQELVVDGPPVHDPETTTIGDGTTAPDRPVVGLPGYRFDCDGSGGCCSQYEAILFTPAERCRAQALYAGSSIGPWPIEHAFVPESGSAPSPVRVPTLRSGSCAFLEDGGACGIHRRAGAEAKPIGCQLFPLRLVDDGEAVRASALTECRCVLTRRDESAPLLVAPRTVVGDFPPATVVRVLPASVWVHADQWWSRDEVRDWCSDALRASMQSEDPALWCWQEGRRLAGLPASDHPASHLLEPFASILERALDRLRRYEAMGTAPGLMRVGMRWVALTAGVLSDSDLVESLVEDGPADPDTEHLAVELMLWAYVGLGRQSLSTWLSDRAVRLWLARAMLATRGEDESLPALAEPIAVVDALMRGHGLKGYVA